MANNTENNEGATKKRKLNLKECRINDKIH